MWWAATQDTTALLQTIPAWLAGRVVHSVSQGILSRVHHVKHQIQWFIIWFTALPTATVLVRSGSTASIFNLNATFAM